MVLTPFFPFLFDAVVVARSFSSIVAVVAARDARERGCGRTGIRREDADDEPAHALIRIVAEQRREEGPRVRPVRYFVDVGRGAPLDPARELVGLVGPFVVHREAPVSVELDVGVALDLVSFRRLSVQRAATAARCSVRAPPKSLEI